MCFKNPIITMLCLLIASFTKGADTPPAWVTTAIQNGWAEGEWLAVSGPNPTSGYGLTPTNVLNDAKTTTRDMNTDGIFDEWNGGWGAPNVRTHGMMGVGVAGGHIGYTGNEIFGFDIATRTWEELAPDFLGARSDGDNDMVHGEFSDGAPIPSHNGSWWYYDTARKELGMPKGWSSTYLGSDAATVPWGHRINLDTLLTRGYSPSLWRRHGQETPDNGGLNQQAGSAWNPVDGKVYYEGAHSSISSSGTFGAYDPVTDTYTEYAQPWSSIGAGFTGANPAIDPIRNVWALYINGAIIVRDLNNPTANRRTNYTGTVGDESWPATHVNKPSLGGRAGWEWSPTRNGFLCYQRMDGGRDFWLAEYTGPATPAFTPNGSTTYELTWKRLDTGANGVNPLAMKTANGNHDRLQTFAWGTTEVAFIAQRENGPVNAFLVSKGSGTAVTSAPQTGDLSVSVFPNPVKAGEAIHIKGVHLKNAKAAIYDVTGKRRAVLNTAGLSSGIYLVKIKAGTQMLTRKLLVTD